MSVSRTLIPICDIKVFFFNLEKETFSIWGLCTKWFSLTDILSRPWTSSYSEGSSDLTGGWDLLHMSVSLYLEVPVKPLISETPNPRVLKSSQFVLCELWHKFSLPIDDILLRWEDERIEDLSKEKESYLTVCSAPEMCVHAHVTPDSPPKPCLVMDPSSLFSLKGLF